MDGDREYPIPFPAFARTLKGTPDEVWTKLIGRRHGAEKHTPAEWRALVERAGREPAHGTR